MRKWMRERIERRKKPGDSAQDTPSQSPLQPAYFDAEALEKQAAEPSAPVAEPEAEPESTEAEGESVAETPGKPAKKRPARRRRRKVKSTRGDATDTTAAEPGEAEEGNAAERPEIEVNGNTADAAAVTLDAPPEAVHAETVPDEPKPPTEAKTSSGRPPRGIVVLAIGLPGSGKSSWFKRHNIHPLSSDLLRQLLFDDSTEQRYQDLVFSNLRSMLKARLIARRPLNYVDATNLTPHDRHSWIRLAKDYGYEVHGVFFDVPVEICIQRNERRHRQVTDEVMRRMAGKLKPPTFEEGFAKITVVRVKHHQDGPE